MECVRFGAAVRGGVRERFDDLQLLDDRTRPAMGHDHRQRILVLRLRMDEVDIQTVDLRHEVRQRFQMRLAPAQIVIRPPVLDEFLHRGELHALCWPHRRRGRPDPPGSGVGHQLMLRPSRHFDAPAQLGDIGFRKADLERTDRGVVGHGLLLWPLGCICLSTKAAHRRRWPDQVCPTRTGHPDESAAGQVATAAMLREEGDYGGFDGRQGAHGGADSTTGSA